MPIRQSYNTACNLIRRKGLDKSSLPILLNKEEEERRKAIEKELIVLEKKIEENPESTSLRIEKGDLLEKTGQHEQAASAYERSLAHERSLGIAESYKVLWKKGKALFKAGKYAEAQSPYKKALLLYPPFSDEYVIAKEYGLILRLIKKPEESLALYKKSLWIEPKYRAANYEKRKVYKTLYSRNKKLVEIKLP